jgi:CBS domain-containing protein
MDRDFITLRPEDTIATAVARFREAGRDLARPVFGMMVTDAAGNLVGMLSIYDIFLLIRPKHIHIWGELQDIDTAGILEQACQRAKNVLVGDVMTTELITITPDTHLLLIIDIMIKKHVRRLPVLEDGRIVGIVYLSRVFGDLVNLLTG